MNNNCNQLLYYLTKENDWVKCKTLANYLGVSERQVRKYITSINAEKKVVLSSPQGYMVNSALYTFNYVENNNDNEIQKRQSYLLQRLMTSPEGVSIYDLADELYVSDSTVNKDLVATKKTLQNFKIELIREKDVVSIKAVEKNLRKLMYSLVSNTSINDGFFTEDFSLFGLDYNFGKIVADIKNIVNGEKINANDFAITNLAIHFIIILDRIRNGCSLEEEVQTESVIYTKFYKIAELINQYAEKEYKCVFSKSELINLALILSNNINQVPVTNYENLSLNTVMESVDPRFVEITYNIIQKTEENYYLPPFKEKFISKLMLHIQNLFFRVRKNYYAKNPLTEKIKNAYPLIYDIAVFIAEQLSKDYDLKLNEDEIAFISFHIGAYFEENSYITSTQVRCAFIYSDYYDFYKSTIERISQRFSDKIAFKVICPISDFDYELHKEKIDLVIGSTLSKSQQIPDDMILYIRPFLRDEDFHNIEQVVNQIAFEKNKAELNDYILSFFSSHLYYSKPNTNSKVELIKQMCDDLYKNNYIDEDFYEDVLKRERLSATAFHDVAVPHAFSSISTRRSFISIALFPEGIEWADNHRVKIVAMIGANKNSRRIFSQFFEQIVAILDNPDNVARLIKTNSFGEFYNEIVRIFNQ